MNKKIGIITFNQAINYGAVLQAFALQQVLLSQSLETDIIDYKCNAIHKGYYSEQYSIKSRIRKMIRFFVAHEREKAIREKFKKFQTFYKQYLVLSKQYDNANIVSSNANYDCFIAGSDQIWNLEISGHDYNYFLDFADHDKKYSYAASFGSVDKINDIDRKNIIDRLSSFKSLLVREKSGADFINSNLNECQRACVVSDPVFLLTENDWRGKLKLNKKEEKFILVYLVTEQRSIFDKAKELSDALHLPVVFIDLYAKKWKKPYEMKRIMNAGPIDFVQYIYQSEYVLTNSFHALAFSLIFNKQCFVELNFKNSNANSRIIDLLEAIGLSDSRIDDYYFDINKVDWNSVDLMIKKEKDNSLSALIKSLED